LRSILDGRDRGPGCVEIDRADQPREPRPNRDIVGDLPTNDEDGDPHAIRSSFAHAVCSYTSRSTTAAPMRSLFNARRASVLLHGLGECVTRCANDTRWERAVLGRARRHPALEGVDSRSSLEPRGPRRVPAGTSWAIFRLTTRMGTRSSRDPELVRARGVLVHVAEHDGRTDAIAVQREADGCAGAGARSRRVRHATSQ